VGPDLGSSLFASSTTLFLEIFPKINLSKLMWTDIITAYTIHC